MQSVLVTLEKPISQFVDQHSRERQISPQQTVMELVALGFNALLDERYEKFRRGEISFGRFAQDLGITSWELSHLLEDRGRAVYNLPTPTPLRGQANLHEETAEYHRDESTGAIS